ncbi:MAG TPA: ABC transporter permease [Puia sp.]|nr:ABC transporter permease [Puia sp.]
MDIRCSKTHSSSLKALQNALLANVFQAGIQLEPSFIIPITHAMLKNYIKTALRNLKRNKSYAFINTMGLMVGISACLLLFLVIQFESSFDNFHPKRDNIYRVGTEFHNQDGISYSDGIALPVAKSLRIDYPQIKEVASIFGNGGQITIESNSKQSKKFIENNFYYTEPEFFSIFNFEWLLGSPKSSLNNPNSAVLTKSTAEKFFGNWKDALGKTILFGNKTVFIVTGILKDIPANSDFPLSIVVPYSALQNTYIKDNLNDWVSTFGSAYTFIVLPPGLSQKKFDQELKVFAKKHKPVEYAKDGYILQPLREIHFDNRFGNFTGHTFSHSLITALSLIGIFLIIIACVNFINLATAQAVNRSKEVGVRKVLGSNRKQLAMQFLSETAIIVSVASIFAILIAAGSLPFLNKLLEVHIALNFMVNPSLTVFIFIVAITVTLFSGIYPAVILSGFNPITALKSRISSEMIGGISLRRGLVVLQFAIAHILIIGMILVVSQMNFFRTVSLGFDKAAIINVPMINDSINLTKLDYIHDKLYSNPDVQSISFSFASPSSENNWNSDFKFDHSNKKTDFSANLKWADIEYFKTFNLKLIAGRCYNPSDTVKEFVVNETLLKKLGIRNPQEAIGKEINFWNGIKVGNIVGVVRDFNVNSLHRPLSPVVMSTWKGVYQTINIKIKPGTEKKVLPFIEKIWTSAYPDFLYEYHFLDETIENFYKQEDQLAQLYKIFAGIAIFISCLGLYGLVSFMAVQRTKEVGIRKVMGASVRNIIYLLSKEFTLLIIIAFFISAPIAYYFMHAWLKNFAYRIELSASIFIMAILGSILIAWLTVAHRAINAALANPITSLRSE